MDGFGFEPTRSKQRIYSPPSLPITRLPIHRKLLVAAHMAPWQSIDSRDRRYSLSRLLPYPARSIYRRVSATEGSMRERTPPSVCESTGPTG